MSLSNVKVGDMILHIFNGGHGWTTGKIIDQTETFTIIEWHFEDVREQKVSTYALYSDGWKNVFKINPDKIEQEILAYRLKA